MHRNYKKFTPADKEAHVTEYLRLSNTIGISQRKYAESHEIPASSFKRWISQYREFMNSHPVVCAENSAGSFIMISEDNQTINQLTKCDSGSSCQGIRLRYKDAVLEFHPEQLREVLEIIRLW